jgi:hypothetical protein
MSKAWWLCQAIHLHEAGSKPKMGLSKNTLYPKAFFGLLPAHWPWYKHIWGQGRRPSFVIELLWWTPKKMVWLKADLVKFSKQGYAFAYDHNHKYIFPFARQLLKVTWNIQRIVESEEGNEIGAGTLLKSSEQRMRKILYCESVHITWSKNYIFLQCLRILLALMFSNLRYECSPPAQDVISCFLSWTEENHEHFS